MELLDAAFKVVATLIMILLLALLGGTFVVFMLVLLTVHHIAGLFGFKDKKEENTREN